MVQPCPECRQVRHTFSCDVPNRARLASRARRDSNHTYDPLAVGFDTPDNGTTYTGGCDTNTNTTGGDIPCGGSE